MLSKNKDLLEPIRIVRQDLSKPVGRICHDGQIPRGFKNVVSFVRHIRLRRLQPLVKPIPHLSSANRTQTETRPPTKTRVIAPARVALRKATAAAKPRPPRM